MITNFNQDDYGMPYAMGIQNTTTENLAIVFVKPMMLFNNAAFFNEQGDYCPAEGVRIFSRTPNVTMRDILYEFLHHDFKVGFVSVECFEGDISSALSKANMIHAHYSNANGDYHGTIVHLLPDPFQHYENIRTAFCDLVIRAQANISIDVQSETVLHINFYPARIINPIHLSPSQKRKPWWKRILYCINRVINF